MRQEKKKETQQLMHKKTNMVLVPSGNVQGTCTTNNIPSSSGGSESVILLSSSQTPLITLSNVDGPASSENVVQLEAFSSSIDSSDSNHPNEKTTTASPLINNLKYDDESVPPASVAHASAAVGAVSATVAEYSTEQLPFPRNSRHIVVCGPTEDLTEIGASGYETPRPDPRAPRKSSAVNASNHLPPGGRPPHPQPSSCDNIMINYLKPSKSNMTTTKDYYALDTAYGSDGEDAKEDERMLRCHNCNQTLTVKFDVYGAALMSEPFADGSADEPFVSIGEVFPLSPSVSHLQGCLSTSSSAASMPICRICHMPGDEEDNLISPCRCSGTMQYIHNNCLMKWLEISSKKSKRPPSCELCLYQYHRHKKFKVKHWQFPPCSIRDRILHTVFFLSLIVMIGAATVTVLCFKQDKGGRLNLDKNKLTRSEIVTLVCGVLFFVAFFLAMYVEVKARNTIYKLLLDFLYLNQQWHIDEYDKKTDIQPVSV